MLVNYRVRCETDTMINGMLCRVIRYGMTKAECNEGLYCPAWYDVGLQPYKGGRTTPREYESAKHFFNKRIMIDDEDYYPKAQAQTVHGDSDAGSVGAPYGEGSTNGVEEFEECSESTGCGDQGTGEEVST